jgi:anti-sigma B factor antagonist
VEAAVLPQLTIIAVPGDPGCLTLHGEIDIYTAPELRDSLRRAVQTARGRTAVMVDLSEVSFIDARGLMALVEAEAYASVRKVHLAFAGVPASITRLLTITGLSLSGSQIS